MKKIVAFIAALCIAMVSLMFTAGTASAHTPQATADCEGLTVNLTRYVAGSTSPARWWNFAPNRSQGPLNSEPAFPTDPRGTWQGPHTNGGPEQNTYGTFRTGGGHGSWFHRERAATTTNHVTVYVDGAVVADTDFATTYQNVFPFDNKYEAHDWKVVVDAWDSDRYDWTKVGRSTPCELPPCDDACALPVVPNSQGDAVCDGANLDGVYDNVTVAPGSHCVLKDVYVNGSVVANNARSLLLYDATVRGSVRANNVSGDVYIGSKSTCKYDPKVGGSIVVKHSHNVLVCDTEVCHDVVLKKNDGKITVRSSSARRFVIQKNRRFVVDHGDNTHSGLSVIRLIDVTGSVVKSGNAPRRVVVK